MRKTGSPSDIFLFLKRQINIYISIIHFVEPQTNPSHLSQKLLFFALRIALNAKGSPVSSASLFSANGASETVYLPGQNVRPCV